MFAGKIQLFHEIGNFVNGQKISLRKFRNGLKMGKQVFHIGQQKAHYQVSSVSKCLRKAQTKKKMSNVGALLSL